jgi:hypothetical protein
VRPSSVQVCSGLRSSVAEFQQVKAKQTVAYLP